MSIAERDYRVLTVGLALCAGFAVVYAALFPGPVAVSSAIIRDAIVFAVLAIIADEMSVEVSDRVTLSAGNLPILLAIMFTGRLPAVGVALLVGLWGAWRETFALGGRLQRRELRRVGLRGVSWPSTPCSALSVSSWIRLPSACSLPEPSPR